MDDWWRCTGRSVCRLLIGESRKHGRGVCESPKTQTCVERWRISPTVTTIRGSWPERYWDGEFGHTLPKRAANTIFRLRYRTPPPVRRQVSVLTGGAGRCRARTNADSPSSPQCRFQDGEADELAPAPPRALLGHLRRRTLRSVQGDRKSTSRNSSH